MRVAVKSTLFLLVLYIIVLVGLAWWMERELRLTVSGVMEDTARLVGNEVAAALHEPVMNRLLQGDAATRQKLRETIETTMQRSDIITSINVVGETGRIVASDDEDMLGVQFAQPADVFQQERQPRLIGSFELFRIGRHILLVPLIQEGRLHGYLRITLSNQPIAGLYDRVYSRLLIAALIGFLAIIGLGLLLQLELGNLDKRLTALLAAAIERGEHPMVGTMKEFSQVQTIAGKVHRELKEARIKAELAWRELDALAKVVKVGVILLGPDGRREFVSEAAVELLVKNHVEQFDEHFQDLKEDLGQAVQRLRTDDAIATTLDLEVSSEAVPRHLRFELYAIDTREWKGCLVLIKDRDMIDALDRDLRAAVRFRNLSRLYMGAAHDLKAPLNAMVINLELLKRTFKEDSRADDERLNRQEQYAGVLTEQLARLNRFLNALLEQAAPSLESRSAVDLKGLVEKLHTLLAPQARLQQVALNMALPDQAVMVFGSPGQLQQALLNVIINGLEAMPRGGKLDIRLETEGAWVRISVCDKGPGIPSALLNKIFDMHFTTKDTGTGIGLYVTRAIIERNGGKIEVQTQLGEGSCFHIYLPLEGKRDESPTGTTADAYGFPVGAG